MLSKQYRFRGLGSVRPVLKYGKTAKSKHLGVKSLSKDQSHPKFAVIVSKKVSKSAVRRNRIRRRIYEAIRMLLPGLNTTNDTVIIVYSSEIAEAPFEELQNNLKDSFEQLGML